VANDERYLLRKLVLESVYEAVDAFELFRRQVGPSSFANLSKAYNAKPSYLRRIDLIELIGKCGAKEAPDFLLKVGTSREHPLVRYYAFRNLIDLGDKRWIPTEKRKLNGDLYGSLLAYMRFRDGEQSPNEVQSLAREKTKYPGDHWEWLTAPQSYSIMPSP
jgi:hypothetical protein